MRTDGNTTVRSEEHTSELQSRRDLVCRLLLEKKNQVVSAARPEGSTGPSVRSPGPIRSGAERATRIVPPRTATCFVLNAPPTTEIYTLSLHDALPISTRGAVAQARGSAEGSVRRAGHPSRAWRSEEHTSELQSRRDLVCRLLLEK